MSIFGFQFSFLLIFVVSANVISGSPGLLGICTVSPPKYLAIFFTLTCFPLPTLKTSFDMFDFEAFKKAQHRRIKSLD